MATKGQKLLAAGTAALIAEPALALAHTGGVGAIVGLAVGAIAYVVVEDVERATGRELSLPTSKSSEWGQQGQDDAQPHKHSLAYRLFHGKSTRETIMPDDQGEAEATNEYADRNAESGASSRQDELLRLGSLANIGNEARFDPHMDDLLGNGLIVAGVQGMGKSNIAALVLESASRCDMPAIMFDLKREYHTIVDVAPNAIRAGHGSLQGSLAGYFALTEENAGGFAQLVMTGKHQAIIDLPSYGEDLNVCAKVITAVLKAFVKWSNGLSDEDRLPCLMMLDEAQVFLPQNQQLSTLSNETINALQAAFWNMCNMGRSMGYTVCFFTQSIANLQKWAIKNCQCKIVGRHVEKNDLDRCVEEVDVELVTREHIKTMPKGVGVVINFTPSQLLVKFDKRVSRHVSNTPNVARLRQPIKEQRVARPQVQPYTPPAENERLQSAQPIYTEDGNGNEKMPIYTPTYASVNGSTSGLEVPAQKGHLHLLVNENAPDFERREDGGTPVNVNVNEETRTMIKRLNEMKNELKLTHGAIAKAVKLSGRDYPIYKAVCKEMGISTEKEA